MEWDQWAYKLPYMLGKQLELFYHKYIMTFLCTTHLLTASALFHLSVITSAHLHSVLNTNTCVNFKKLQRILSYSINTLLLL